ncbi:hypothetical protein [Deinococcus soli (ex Cha et al. 2016)]|uniref:hypothetical protein n=1 Tax=Deinococcus soli (ex Cha et al. 2016) TaxID=1309411 RepID=UPI0019C7FBE2|nr:hypothetical protein [Deinococcus soli (ex Cha et al. 2016)]GGB73646.1 hypothetical protein GCM10008019_32310 [Deinococcus soli (ex Cha et al. 2016)]
MQTIPSTPAELMQLNNLGRMSEVLDLTEHLAAARPDPSDVNGLAALTERGIAFMRLGRISEAMTALRYPMQCGFERAALDFGVCYVHIGDIEAAHRHFEALLPTLSANELPNGRRWVAMTLHMLGRTQDAFDQASAAITDAQATPRAAFWLGLAQTSYALILMDRGDYNLAALNIESALQSEYTRVNPLARAFILQFAILIHIQRDNLEHAKLLAAEAEALLDPDGLAGRTNRQQTTYYAQKLQLARTLIGSLEGDPAATREHAALVEFGMLNNDSDTLIFYAAGEIERLGEAGDIDGALKLLGQLPAYRISAPGAFTTAAIAMTLAGRCEDASVLFSQSLDATLQQGLKPLHARGQLYYGLCQTLQGDPEGLTNLKRAAEMLRRLGLNAVTRRDLQRVSAKLTPDQVTQVLDAVTMMQTRRLASKVITVRLLGDGELLLDGAKIELLSAAPRAAVLMNLLSVQPELSTAQIAEALFDQDVSKLPSDEARRLKTQVSGLVLKIRKAFGDDNVILLTGPRNSSMYQLGRPSYQVVVDVDQLEENLRSNPLRLLHVAQALRGGILPKEDFAWVNDRREQVLGHFRDALMEAVTSCQSAVGLEDLATSVALFSGTDGVIEEEVLPLYGALEAARVRLTRGAVAS